MKVSLIQKNFDCIFPFWLHLSFKLGCGCAQDMLFHILPLQAKQFHNQLLFSVKRNKS